MSASRPPGGARASGATLGSSPPRCRRCRRRRRAPPATEASRIAADQARSRAARPRASLRDGDGAGDGAALLPIRPSTASAAASAAAAAAAAAAVAAATVVYLLPRTASAAAAATAAACSALCSAPGSQPSAAMPSLRCAAKHARTRASSAATASRWRAPAEQRKTRRRHFAIEAVNSGPRRNLF